MGNQAVLKSLGTQKGATVRLLVSRSHYCGCDSGSCLVMNDRYLTPLRDAEAESSHHGHSPLADLPTATVQAGSPSEALPASGTEPAGPSFRGEADKRKGLGFAGGMRTLPSPLAGPDSQLRLCGAGSAQVETKLLPCLSAVLRGVCRGWVWACRCVHARVALNLTPPSKLMISGFTNRGEESRL